MEKILSHIAVAPRIQERLHQDRVVDLSEADIAGLFREILAPEGEPRTKT